MIMAMFKTVEPPELTLAIAEGNLQKVRELVERGKLVTVVEEESDFDCLVFDSDGAGDVSSSSRRQKRVPVDINESSEAFPTPPLHTAIERIGSDEEGEKKCEDMVKYLLVQPKIDVNKEDGGGFTPLLLAAKRGNLSIFKSVFSARNVLKNAATRQGENALMCAAKAGHLEIVKFLGEEQDLGRKNEFGYTAVGLAAGGGYLDVVKELTDTEEKRSFVQINAKAKDTKKTLLSISCNTGNLDLVQYILSTEWQEEINVNARDSNHKTALMLASAYGYRAIVEELCKRGADVTLVEKESGYNSLMLACVHGHHETVEILLQQNKTDITVTDHLGRNALLLAVKMHKPECVKVICDCERLNAIIKVLAKTIKEQTGQDVRQLSAHDDVAREDPPPAITMAAISGDLDKVKKLLQPQKRVPPIDINATTKEVPYTALHAAISAVDTIEKEIQDEKNEDKRKEIKKRLSQAERNERLQQLETRLETAEKLVKYLVEQKDLDINAKDSVGDTPLLLAAKVGNVTVLETLREATGLARGNVQDKNKLGEDVLMCATISGNLDAVKYIIDNTSERNLKKVNEFGYTAIHLGTQRGYVKIVEFLVEKWCEEYETDAILSLNRTKDTGRTLLMLAVLSGEKGMVEFWLSSPSKNMNPEHLDGNETDDSGKTALMLGAANGHSEIVKLCCRNADVNLRDRDQGYNALMLACLNGHHKTVKALLEEEEIDFHAADHHGRNTLYLAARKCDKECLKVILECGKSEDDMCTAVNARTTKGDTNALTAVPSTNPDAKTLRRQLLEAGGCDVRTILPFQKDLRKNVRQTFMDGGKDDWSYILKQRADVVLPVLVLMAESKDTEETEHDTDDFWKFFANDMAGRKYLSGEEVDEQRNTVFHYFAKSKCVAIFQETLPSDQVELAGILENQNAQNNTPLHVAAVSGCLKEVFRIITERTQNTPGLAVTRFRDALKKKNPDNQTFVAVAVNAGMKGEHIREILESLQNHSTGYFKIICEDLWRSRDAAGNTLLHMAVKNSNWAMISYLADKPIDEGKNRAGFNPLHSAVRGNNMRAFQHILDTFGHRLRINDPTGDEETVLHIAAKQGNVDMIEKIVKLGGDLSYQDNDGHTPLHDCLQQVYLEGGFSSPKACNKFKDVWEKVVDVAVIWWCGPSLLNVPLPDKGSERYQKYKRSAVYCLRSLLRNKKGHSVLQYAARRGLSECVAIMLTTEDVFVRSKLPSKEGAHEKCCACSKCCCSCCGLIRRSCCCVTSTNKHDNEYEIEITNLSPEYEFDFIESEDYKEVHAVRDKVMRYKGKKTTFVEILAAVKPALKASEVLQCVPMFRITKWQWRIYQWFGILWLFTHCFIMGFASLNTTDYVRRNPTEPSENVENERSSMNTTNGTAVSGQSVESFVRSNFDQFVPIYATFLFIVLTVVPFVIMVYTWYSRRTSLEIPYREPSYQQYDEYTEDRGVILSLISRVIQKLLGEMTMILSTLFAIFSWYQFELQSEKDSAEYAWVKGIFLFLGWLIVLIPARTFRPIYTFLSTLKSIVIKDMIPFVLFYLTITIAFSCAVQLQLQLLPVEGEDGFGFDVLFHDVHKVFQELVVITTGMETELKNIQYITDRFHQDALSSIFIRLLLIAYAVLSVIILLNMLIAMMGTTLSMVISKEGTGWRQHQVRQALWIRSSLVELNLIPRRILACCGRMKCGRGVYTSVPQNPHIGKKPKNLFHIDHPKRRACTDSRMQNRDDKVRQIADSKRWYMTLSNLELKEIRAKHWQHVTVEEKITDNERNNVEERIESIENNIEAMQETLKGIEKMLGRIKIPR